MSVKGTFLKPKPFRNKYRFKKQWNRILSALIAPNDIPLSFTKNVRVLFSNGDQFTAKNQLELDIHIEKAAVNGLEIKEICVELNYEKLISVVEKKYESLTKRQ